VLSGRPEAGSVLPVKLPKDLPPLENPVVYYLMN
jgi:hypothetical protein